MIGQPFDGVAEEARKSNLLLHAALLREQGNLEQASTLFATAAEIEERLAKNAEARDDKSVALRAWYSAASAWAHAGDFHHALTLLRSLEARPDIPPVLQTRIRALSTKVQQHRENWREALREHASA